MSNMSNQTVARVTITLTKNLLAFADRLAKERSTSRSGVLAELLGNEEEVRANELMAEGYRAMAEENRREAEQSIGLTGEVVLRDG